MNIGNWNIEVNMNGMPQKVATAFDKVNETLVGAEYEMIAYLGSQEVNGINHAVLAKQILTTGRDSVNIVVMIFNEKPKAMEATLAAIERVLEEGMPLGGTVIHVDRELDPEFDAMKVWNEAFDEWVGASVKPFAYLGSQEANGLNLFYAAIVEPIALDGRKRVDMVCINPVRKQVTMTDMLANRHETSLNYAFSW